MGNFEIKKHIDKLLFVLALAVLAGVLIRFGIGKIASRVKPNIVFTQCWENDLGREVLLDLIREFENTHDGIKVTLNYLPYESLHDALLEKNNTAAFSGDVFSLDTLWIPELLKRKTIDFYIKEGKDQQNLSVPLFSFINVFYYNIDILKNAGFSHPPKNRSEFLAFAKAVTNGAKDRWALGMGKNSSRWIYDDIFPWIWASGAELAKDGKPAFTSRSITESLLFLASLENSGLIAPDWSGADTEKKLADFISGRAAFMVAPAKDIAFVREKMGEGAFSVSSIPAPDNHAGKTRYASLGWTLGISSKSTSREKARLFADFIAEKAQTLSEKLVPAGNLTQDPLYAKVWDISISGENAQDFSGLPWEKLEEAFSEEFSLLLAGKASPAETAAATQKKWEAISSR